MADLHAVHELRAHAPGPLGLEQAGALALGLSACTFVIALATGGVASGVGTPSRGGLSSPVADLALAVVGLLAALGLGFLLRGGWRREEADLAKPRQPLWQRLLILAGQVAVLTALFAAVVTLLPSHPFAGHGAGHGGHPVATVKPRAPSPRPGGPLDTSWAQGAALAVGAVLGTIVLLALFRQPSRQRTGSPRAAQLERAIAAGSEGLESESDPRQAVIRAYAGMERVLAEEGLPRRPSETPFEFLRRALTRLQASGRAAARLTSLFERAKFSQHDVDDSMRREALGALADMRSELEQ